jgi:hypothetical protein
MKYIVTLMVVFMMGCNTKNSSPDKIQQANLAHKDTLYFDDEFLIMGEKGEKIEVIRQKNTKQKESEGDTLFANEYVSILGNSAKEPQIFLKYNARYKFEDFPMEVYEGKLAKPNFGTNKDAKRFVTRITEGSQKRPNFAGKLTIIEWGCGTGCQSAVMLNAETGEIYDGITTSCGYKSMPNSRLLVANYGFFEGKEQEWIPFFKDCMPVFYVWDWGKKQFVKLK